MLEAVRKVVNAVGYNFRQPPTPGVGVGPVQFAREHRHGPRRQRANYALDIALAMKPRTALDVGSGDGRHAGMMKTAGVTVTCIDFGTSIYAQARHPDAPEPIKIDFRSYVPATPFDLVWASHVLEHQRNVGDFIERLIAYCHPEGTVAITVPDPHRKMCGGHLTLWSPGFLAYNVVICGVDISGGVFVRGTDEFSLFFQPKRVTLPALTFDNGDLDLLKPFMPAGLGENSDPWAIPYAKTRFA